MNASGSGTEQYDVIIVGAGPAGCACAAALHQDHPELSVLMIDRSRFPRDKTCGDGIAAEVGLVLEELGFDPSAVFAGTVPVPQLAVRSPTGVEVLRTMARQVYVVPREIFDARLVSDLDRRGIEVRTHVARSIRLDDEGAVIDDTLRARVLIGADGAESAVRRAAGMPSQRAGTVALAIRGYAPELEGQQQTQIIRMTDRHWPAYAWSFPLGDGRANVGYGEIIGPRSVTRQGLIQSLHQLLPDLTAEPENLRAHRLPLSSGRPPIAAGRALLVGDAQSMINPFTGEGIFYAVTSGQLAGQAAGEALTRGADPGLIYRESMRNRLGRHLRHTSTLARFGSWPGLVDAGVRAAKADQRCFDDLVAFGLADGLLTPRLIGRLRFWG